jgi:hypothetical protein
MGVSCVLRVSGGRLLRDIDVALMVFCTEKTKLSTD